MFRNWFKKDQPIQVTVSYWNGTEAKGTWPNFKYIKDKMLTGSVGRYDDWINNDEEDLPYDGYLVTGIKFKDGKLSELKLTEQMKFKVISG